MSLVQKNRAQKPVYLNAVFLGSGAFVFINFGLSIRADDQGIAESGGNQTARCQSVFHETPVDAVAMTDSDRTCLSAVFKTEI